MITTLFVLGALVGARPAVPSPNVVHVPLTIVAFSGSASSMTVANGIPLAPGMLQPSALSTVRLFVDGVEQPIYVESLGATHSDGSLRSVFVAFHLAMGRSQPVSAELQIGAARSATLPKPALSRAIPQAAALPSSADYLLTTDLVLPTKSVSQVRAAGGIGVAFDSAYCCAIVRTETGSLDTGFANYHWRVVVDGGSDVNATIAANYYDRALGYYAAWVRTGNPTYWYRATRLAVNYREQYLRPGVKTYGGAQPYEVQLEGIQKHYLLTGDSLSRQVVLGQMELYRTFWEHFEDVAPGTGAGNSYSDDRSRARLIMGYLLAWQLDPNGATGSDRMHDPYPPTKYADILRKVPARLLRTQDSVTGRDFTLGSTQLPYMQGMVGDALIAYAHWYAKPPSLVTYMQRSAAWLWTQTKDNGASFAYANQRFDWGAGLSGDASPTSDLNLLMANTFAFMAHETGSQIWAQRYSLAFAGGVRGAWLYAAKAFNQNYSTGWAGFGLAQP